jgi:hypothetical protein
MNYEKVVVISCQRDEKGKVLIGENFTAPYGFHHVLGIRGDEIVTQIAYIDFSVRDEKLRVIVNILAGDTPVEFDQEFYRKRRTARYSN